MRRLAVAVLVAMLFASPALAQRQRAATPAPADVTSVAGWLSVHARPLVSVEPYPFSYDLEPLGRMVADAAIVGLGDGTHGTREFFTVKQRIIEYLAREKDFDVVAFEAPFSTFNRLNEWVLGGAGDPAEILREADRGGYYFWYTEEILDLAKSLREYNARRGDKRAIEVAGVDIYGFATDADAVVAYLRGVDPAAAAEAEALYGCIAQPSAGCKDDIARVHDQLAARRGELVPRSSARAFENALRAAFVVRQYFEGGPARRDTSMAENALWLREHRSTSRRIMLWAHNEHLGKTRTTNAPDPMGRQLAAALGDPDAYFVIATLAGSGSFLQTTQGNPGGATMLVAQTFRPMPRDSYEARFSEAGAAALLIPLDAPPSWLAAPANFRWAGSGPVGGNADVVQQESLPEKFDAIVFIASTTPARVLPR